MDAVEQLYREHGADLIRLLRLRCGDHDSAVDAVHEAFALLQQPRHRRRAAEVGELAWLRTRSRFELVDQHRKRTGWRQQANGAGPVGSRRPIQVGIAELDEGGRADVYQPHGVLDEGLRRVELRELVDAALRRFPGREQQLLRLRFLDDLSQAEMGRRLGLTESRVCQLLKPLLVRLGYQQRAYSERVRPAAGVRSLSGPGAHPRRSSRTRGRGS